MAELILPIENKGKIVKHKQSTADIAKYMLIAERDSRKYHPKLVEYFDTGDDLETAKEIHAFARENLVYKKESPRKQIVRTAPRVLNDIYVDCKGYSTFILAALRACGIDSWYRLAGYDYGSKIPTHVYCMANIDGKEVVIDGTLNSFGFEAPAVVKYNLRPLTNFDNMALSYVQGVSTVGSRASRKAKKEKRQAKKSTKKAAKQEKKAAKKEKQGERRDTRKQKVAKIAAAPARGAFLVLIKMNAFKLATKLAQAIKKDRTKVSTFWAKFGGNWDDLVKEINKKSGEAAVGAVTMTAALAAATPLLIAVGTLLKSLNLQSEEEAEELDEGIDDGLDIIDSDPEFEKKIMAMPRGERVAKVMSTKDYQENIDPSADNDGDDDDEGDNTMLWVVGAAAALIFMKSK